MKKFQAGGLPTAVDVSGIRRGGRNYAGRDDTGVYAPGPSAYGPGMSGEAMEQEASDYLEALEAKMLRELSQPYYTPEQQREKDRLEENARLQGLVDEINAAETDLENLYRARDVVIDKDPDSDNFGKKIDKKTGLLANDPRVTMKEDVYFPEVTDARDKVRAARDAAREAGINLSDDGWLAKVGETLNRVSGYTGIPLPDFVFGGPGGITGTWGTPTGTPVGTTTVPGTAGSTYSGGPTRAGVVTGIPAIDLILSQRNPDGDSRFGLPTLEDITEILTETGGVPGVLKTPPTTSLTPDVEEGEDTTKVVFGDNSPPKIDDETTNTNTDLTDEEIVAIINETTNTEAFLTDEDENPYLDLNQDETTNPEDEDETTNPEDEASSAGGGGGYGQGQGVAVTTGAPGGVVDLDYLYDISGRSIFGPSMQDETKDTTTPYVYAKSGGMIRNNYDLTDEILRRLIRGR